MKRIFRVIIVIITFSFINVKANSINSIDMDIYIDNNGNANITEEWAVSLDSGTEGYHPYFNIGNSSITFNSVTDDLGNNYTYNPNWDINNSFDGKSKTFGIVNYSDDDEHDLCWGITEYGYRVYTLNYTINNFIYNTSDGYQMLYWTLIPEGMSSSIGNVHIKVHGDNKFSDKLPVWGYGNYGGTAYVYDGVIEMNSPDAGLSTDQYMTLLVKFNSNSFNTTNSIDKTWNEVYSESKEGANKYKNSKNNKDLERTASLMGIFFTCLFIFMFLGIPYIIKKVTTKVFFRSNGSKLLHENKLNNVVPWRDIPFGDDYFYANYLAQEYGLVNGKGNIMGALFLKWIKNGNISVTTEERGVFKNKHTKFLINKRLSTKNVHERELWKMVKEAATDNILDEYEFKSYCECYYLKLNEWFKEVYNDSFSLIKDNKKYVNPKEVKRLVGTEIVFIPTSKLDDDARKMAGLKLFFDNFGSLNEKEPIDVKQWRDYLIYAQILGVARKVAKEFKLSYPDIVTDDCYDDVILINDFANSGVQGVGQGKSYADAEKIPGNYSSGGGGFSSGGGGGGSFGGGGSGGGFR